MSDAFVVVVVGNQWLAQKESNRQWRRQTVHTRNAKRAKSSERLAGTIVTVEFPNACQVCRVKSQSQAYSRRASQPRLVAKSRQALVEGSVREECVEMQRQNGASEGNSERRSIGETECHTATIAALSTTNGHTNADERQCSGSLVDVSERSLLCGCFPLRTCAWTQVWWSCSVSVGK
jgi:hypothetical protein